MSAESSDQNPASETLLDPSGVRLFGREMSDLVLKKSSSAEAAAGGAPARHGANSFLKQQLTAEGATLARIYGFSYEGFYYELSQPAIFLVHGPGTPVESPEPGSGLPSSRVARSAPSVSHTGVAARDMVFADDIHFWAYDQGDFSLRLDMETGPLKDILLDASLGHASSYSGADARLRYSGADARLRYSGADARLRYSGADARVRGGRGSD